MAPSLQSLDLIGSHIKLIDTQNNTIEGEIYAYDRDLELLVLYESGDQHVTSKRKSFRTLHANKGIKKIISIEKPENPSVPFYNTPLPPMDMDKIEETVEIALQERKKKIGVGVTNKAQHIFDVLSKTLPTRWDTEDRGTIVVMEDLKIKKPYGPENVSGGLNEASRSRIQRILKGEQTKLEKEMAAFNKNKPKSYARQGDSEYRQYRRDGSGNRRGGSRERGRAQ